MNNFEDTTRLLELLKLKYGFDGFYHYTDYSNLKRIYEAGALLCRSGLGNAFYDSANQGVLHRAPEWIHDQVRLFYFPKTPFLYKIEGIKPKSASVFSETLGVGPHMPRPVALLFSEEVAYIDGIKYLDGSASNLLAENTEYIPQITTNAKDAINYNWDLINYRGAIPTIYGNLVSVFGETNGGIITNHKNAEILIPHKLPLSYLKGIIFRSEADKKQAIAEYGESDLFSVNNGAFNNTNSYLSDYTIDWAPRAKNVHIDLEIFAPVSPNKYQHYIRFYDGNGLRIEESLDLQNRYESVDLNNCEDITRIEYYMDDVLCAAWEANRW